MNVSFDYNEMKNFISHTGKYKIVNVKCFIQVPSSWYNQFRREEEEVDMEVAYLIDDIETEKFKADKFILGERYCIYENPLYCKLAIQSHGMSLQLIVFLQMVLL